MRKINHKERKEHKEKMQQSPLCSMRSLWLKNPAYPSCQKNKIEFQWQKCLCSSTCPLPLCGLPFPAARSWLRTARGRPQPTGCESRSRCAVRNPDSTPSCRRESAATSLAPASAASTRRTRATKTLPIPLCSPIGFNPCLPHEETLQ